LTSEAGASTRVDERFAFAPHRCFACGTLNRDGLQLELHVDANRCWTTIAIPERFQGWNDIAHGGIVSTILDEVMAWSLVEHDTWGVTARLAVEFRRPVPLGRPVRAEGWVVEARRRVFRTASRLVDAGDGTLLAEADATYVAAREDRKQELKRRYGYREPVGGRR
jgi:acyl-coenzyme A thioesterase PaaI-like protein